MGQTTRHFFRYIQWDIHGDSMPTKFKMKLARIGNSLRITIPKPAVDGMGLRQGDVLSLTVIDHEIRIRKAPKSDAD